MVCQLIKLGSYEVVMSKVLFVPDSEVVCLDVPIGDISPLNVRMEFTQDDENTAVVSTSKSETGFVVEYEDEDGKPIAFGVSAEVGCVVMKFHNFNKSFGQTLQAPQVIAEFESATRQVSFLAAIYKFGKVSKVEFQFMVGSKS